MMQHTNYPFSLAISIFSQPILKVKDYKFFFFILIGRFDENGISRYLILFYIVIVYWGGGGVCSIQVELISVGNIDRYVPNCFYFAISADRPVAILDLRC